MADLVEISTGEIEAASPLTFSQVGFLLARPVLWGDWLADHPDRADLFRDAFSCVVRLRSHTGWTDDQTLDGLGCDTRSKDKLSKLTKEHLTNCLGYMLWVEDLLTPYDLAIDKRIIVRGAARFFVLVGKDLDRAEAIMPSPKKKATARPETEGSEFPPSEYLALGEIARAWRSAARQLEGQAGDRARHLHDENPFIDERTPHLSPKRLEMLARADADELLGPRVAARMREHIALCRICEAAAGRKDTHPPAPAQRPLSPA